MASNLPVGKYIKPPPSTAKLYKVGQPCFEDKIQELNTDFSKICIFPKPSGPLWASFPYQFLRNWNIKLGRTSLLLTLRLPLLRLLLPVTLLCRSVNTVLSLPSKRLKARNRKVPILRKQPGVNMIMPVTILRF